MRYLLVLMIFVLGTLTGCQQGASQTANSTANANSNKTAKPAATPDDAKRISVAEAKTAVDAGKAVIVDVRSADAWKNDRIKDSLSVPFGEMDAKYTELPKDKELIFYCSCPSEHTSVLAVNKAKEKGNTNTSALLGGTEAWRSAGNPMDGEAKKPAGNAANSNGNSPVKKP